MGVGALNGERGRKSRFGTHEDLALKSVLNFNVPFSTLLTVTATGAAAGFGSVQLLSLPVSELWYVTGKLYIEFAETPSVTLPTANLSDTWSGNYSLGFLKNADADLADSGDVDFLASTAIGPAVSGAIARSGIALTALNNTLINNQDKSKAVWLNMLVGAADISDNTSAQIKVSGTLRMLMFPFGKNT